MRSQSGSKTMSYSMIKRKIFNQISKAQFDRIFQNQTYIGSGMQGEVYKANYGDNLVAIKYFRKQFVGMEYISYIQSEIQTLSEMQNENIVSFIDSYQVVMGNLASQKKYCIVTEYCQQSLSSYHVISQLSNLKKLHMCLELVSAVKAAHEKGIIHRDIKPQNILIKDLQTMTIKLADFGCCRIGSEDVVSMTRNVGTPLYADPNIQLGKYSKKCDVYSLGLVIVYIFCGRQYFSDCDTREKLVQAKKKICQNTQKQTRSFLRKYDLDDEIQEFIINITFYTLSENEEKRLSSDMLYEFIKKEIIKYKMQLQNAQQGSSEFSSSCSSVIRSNLEHSQFQQFKQTEYKNKFSKSKNQQVRQQIIQEKYNSHQQDVQNEDYLDNVPIKQVQNKLDQSQISQKKSEQTTDRLTQEPKSSQKSNQQNNYPHSAYYECDSFYSSQNQDFNRSNGQITSQDIPKVQEKVNQSQFIKKSCINDEIEFNTNSKTKSKNQKVTSGISTQRYNSTILLDNKNSVQKRSESAERKQKIQLQSKVLSDSQKLCAQIIKYGSQCRAINDQCETMSFLLSKLQLSKASFQQIKKIQEVLSYSMTFQQKQTIVFLFHCLYVCQLKDFMNFLYGGTSKLFARLGKISEQNKQFIQSILIKETQRVYPNLKKYSADLNRKSGLIKPKLGNIIINLISEVVLCGNSLELLRINSQQNLIINETNNFISQKLKEIKNQDDRQIIEGLRLTSNQIVC